LALALLLSISAAAAADTGLDLAVLVDRSTSMAARSHSQAVFLRMTLDLVARNAAANRVEHRIAVIGFGSSATVDVPFTSVGQSDLRQLRRRIEALRYEDRGDTNVLAALVLAEQQFGALPRSPERRRAIVLLTDGVPYVRGGDMRSYRADLQRFVETRLARFGVTIDVLLIDSRDSAFWQRLGRVELTGHAPDRLLPQAHGVIARLVGTRTAESAPAKTRPAVDTLVVPPYLDIIVFDIFRASPGAAVEILPPHSTEPIRAGAGGIESVLIGDVLATLVVPRPAPGEWTIRKSRAEARVRILSQQFFPRGLLLQPSETTALRRCDRVALSYRVLDGNGHPLDELRDYTLSLEVTLAKPDGANAGIGMERDPALPSAFRSTQDIVCELAGRYWTDVRITTVDAGGHRLDVFRDRWSGFSVAPGTPGRCRAQAVKAGTARPERNSAPPRPSGTSWIVAAFLLGVVAIAAWVRQKTKS
jgi:uncharacterized protein YegL